MQHTRIQALRPGHFIDHSNHHIPRCLEYLPIYYLSRIVKELLRKCKVTNAVASHLTLTTNPSVPNLSFWWSQAGSNRRPPACKAGALPAELWPLFAGLFCAMRRCPCHSLKKSCAKTCLADNSSSCARCCLSGFPDIYFVLIKALCCEVCNSK